MCYALNDHQFLQADISYAVESWNRHWRSGGYFKIAVDDSSSILGFLIATETKAMHSPDRFMRQEYFCTSPTLKGFKSVRVVKLLHEDLIDYAKRQRCKFVASSSSHLDEDFVFTKILEKFGWERRGYVAKYYL
jgi:hypothetical protein